MPAVVDNTFPLTVTASPTTGNAPLTTAFGITKSDPRSRSVHREVSFGDGTPGATGDITHPYPGLDLANTCTAAGAYRASVTVTNGTGASTVSKRSFTVKGYGGRHFPYVRWTALQK